MAHRYRRVGRLQEKRHRFADQPRAPDHNGLPARNFRSAAPQEFHAASRRAGRFPSQSERKLTKVQRVKTVYVLRRIDSFQKLVRVQPVRKRQLQENTVERVVRVERVDARFQLVHFRFRRVTERLCMNPDGRARPFLIAHVHLARRVVADENHGQPRHDPAR